MENDDNYYKQWRVKKLVARHGALLPVSSSLGTCDNCGHSTQVFKAPIRTAYEDDSRNVSPMLCSECLHDYNDYWDDMWSNVHG